MMSGSLITKRVHVGRQGEIVVDRLRYVDDTDAAHGLALQLHGGSRGGATCAVVKAGPPRCIDSPDGPYHSNRTGRSTWLASFYQAPPPRLDLSVQ